MRVLLIGSGAREHALAHALKSDTSVSELHVAPGNPGISQLATLHQVKADDPQAVTALAKKINAELVVIGPEAPLVAGVVDAIRAIGIPCFGPSMAAAQLEGSKSFAKEIMAIAGVPTAKSKTCITQEDIESALDGDAGPNTGGMGAYSPLPWAPSDIIARTEEVVLKPVIKAMAKRGTPFIGLLYAGLAMTSKGMRVIEFNARFGDPETEVLLPRLKTPLAQLLLAAATGKLAAHPPLQWSSEQAVTIVLASEGYPERPQIGKEITGLGESGDAIIYHAGTAEDQGRLLSAGGRVLAITGLGSDLATARANGYRALAQISLAGGHYRKDIALTASNAQKEA